MTLSTAATVDRANFRSDSLTISAVSLAHGTSHFFQLLLPPLFPWFAKDFDLSFAQLGTLATLFYVVSAAGQAVAGFIVDRVGARIVMFAALLSFAASAMVGANADGYGLLAFSAVLAGLGNSPFHPVDYSIINLRVSEQRIGHAYSAHGLSGTLGYASATFIMVMLATSFGWRIALYSAAGLALAVLIAMIVMRDALDTRAALVSHNEKHAANGAENSFAFLRLTVVWICFAYFFVSTFASAAIQNFSPSALVALTGIELTRAATALTGFLVFAAVGQVLGGFVVSKKWLAPEHAIAAALGFSATMLFLVGVGVFSGTFALFATMVAGLGGGIAGPSRDLLVKRATPANATGRVYGAVYSGLDTGLAIAAPMFGWFMDHEMPRAIFIGAAIALVISLGMGLLVSRASSLRAQHSAAH
jgi:MFS transporter, FSR family, fosmidomycin resistance protein